MLGPAPITRLRRRLVDAGMRYVEFDIRDQV